MSSHPLVRFILHISVCPPPFQTIWVENAGNTLLELLGRNKRSRVTSRCCLRCMLLRLLLRLWWLLPWLLRLRFLRSRGDGDYGRGGILRHILVRICGGNRGTGLLWQDRIAGRRRSGGHTRRWCQSCLWDRERRVPLMKDGCWIPSRFIDSRCSLMRIHRCVTRVRNWPYASI